MVRWADDPNGPYIRLHSGRKFYLANPKPEMFYVPDIAFHLAGTNRYTGGSRFSVAQHEVVGAWMAERFYPEHKALPARFMIHDIAEFAYGDMSSPLKRLCPDYKRLIQVAEAVSETAFDLTFLDDPLVKELDERMWLTEREMVFRDVDQAEDYEGGKLEPFPLSVGEMAESFISWGPEEAEEQWLMEFRRLLPWVDWT